MPAQPGVLYQEADQLRCRVIERAPIEAELAQRRFMLVDPSNRLVADTLERDGTTGYGHWPGSLPQPESAGSGRLSQGDTQKTLNTFDATFG